MSECPSCATVGRTAVRATLRLVECRECGATWLEDAVTGRPVPLGGAPGLRPLPTAVGTPPPEGGRLHEHPAGREGVGAPSNGNGMAAPDGDRRDHVMAELSTREREVVGLLTGGLTNREIARRLFLSEKTVKAHLLTACRKLGVRNRTEAAIMAVRLGMGPTETGPQASHLGTMRTLDRNGDLARGAGDADAGVVGLLGPGVAPNGSHARRDPARRAL